MQEKLPLCRRVRPLKPGDLLRVIASSGCLREPEAVAKGIEVWRSRGYRVELSEGYDSRCGYLAGPDQARRYQLAQAWNDPECRGILCLRGGYGGMRLLEDWTWPVGEEGKWLIGFSDVTALLWSLGTVGISGVHGPLLTTIAQEPEWSLNRLFEWVERGYLPALKGVGMVGGVARGLLLPANLTVATHLLGTKVQPALEGVILALEDVGEAPYRIDRMLTQWRLMGIFSGVKGIALGRFSRCDAPQGIPSFTINEVLKNRLGDLGVPVVTGLPFGHDGENGILPVGMPVILDGDEGSLRFEV